ncbi:MAG: thiamine phosphate synthase [Gammaproteobacteria bacterium]
MAEIDIRLYGIADADTLGREGLAELAAAAGGNGATVIQYRDKSASTAAMIACAAAIMARLAPFGVPLLVNDRVDVALAAGADGVHLGREDMPPALARRLLGAGGLIGLTVKNEADADLAIASDINYACVGGVFTTLSKNNPDVPVGPEGLTRLIGRIRAARPELPIGAIAGIGLERVPQVIAGGADGVALISALFKVPDPARTTRMFRAAVDEMLETRR